MALRLTSVAFRQGGDIPKKYTCDGDNVSPPFGVGCPRGHAQLPAYLRRSGRARRNIPPLGRLRHPAGLAGPERGARRGKSDEWLSSSHQRFGQAGLLGSLSAARDKAHRYHFQLNALSEASLPVAPSATCLEVITLATPFLEFVELVGLYQRLMKHKPRRVGE